MQQIHPICHDNIYPHVGKKVCAVTHDGKHYYGTIGDVRDGRVLLTDCRIGSGDQLSLSAVRAGSRAKKQSPQNTAKLSAFYNGYGNDFGYGFGYGFGAFWLPLAVIASLFFLPFFFF